MTLVSSVLIGYILLLVIGFLFIENIVFRPSQITVDYVYTFAQPHEEIFLEVEGERINALYFTVPSAKGCVLYFHGNSGSLDMWGYANIPFTDRGYNVLIIDYPGYGKSTGKVTEQSVYASADAAYNHVADKYSPENIIVYGRSIGGGPASYVAHKYPARELILETPFYSMDQLLKYYAPFIFKIVPSKVQLRVDKHVAATKLPITVIHGTEDRVVPYSSAEQLKNVIKPTDKFITVLGGDHNNMMQYLEVQEVLDEILN